MCSPRLSSGYAPLPQGQGVYGSYLEFSLGDLSLFSHLFLQSLIYVSGIYEYLFSALVYNSTLLYLFILVQLVPDLTIGEVFSHIPMLVGIFVLFCLALSCFWLYNILWAHLVYIL